MTAFIVRRGAAALVVVAGLSVIGFAILALAPGDPVLVRISPEVAVTITPEQLEVRRRELGLDGPITERYIRWLAAVIRGDFGYSIASGRPVAEELLARLGPTALLMGTAISIAVGIGVPLGVLAAVRQYKWIDYLISSGAMLAAAAPSFFMSIAAIYIFSVTLRLLPAGNLYTLGRETDIVDRVRHLILPAAVLGLAQVAPLIRYTRASYLGVKHSPYMMTAKAKGLPPRITLFRHGLRNALIPIITVVALQLPELVAGTVIVEQIFAWPGMGQLAVSAANNRDPALMMSVVLIAGLAVVISSLLADVAYAASDPRVRVS